MADEQRPRRKKISNEMIEEMYPHLRAIAEDLTWRVKKTWEIVGHLDMNHSSARDFVDIFLRMLRGDKYQRLNTIFGTAFFLKKIQQDFGDEELLNALSSVRQHLAYYERVSGNPQNSIRKILEKYTHLAPTLVQETKEAVALRADELADEKEFDPENEEDARKKVLTSIAIRQGRPQFRDRLMRLYGGRCAISACAVKEVLEAAHISRYLGPQTNHPTNGLLLRSDLHTLFDHGLLAIDSRSMTVLVSPTLRGSLYEKNFAARKLRLPSNRAYYPNAKVLDKHREESGL